MKIELRILALALVALFGSLLASSQGIAAYQMTDRPSVSLAAGPSVLGASGDVRASVIPAPGSPVTSSILFLPMVTKPVEGILGYLTQGGAPAPSISLELRLFNGSIYSTAATAITDSSGYYLFVGMPALGAGQFYYVRYRNLEKVNSRLSSWGSSRVLSYTTGSSVSLGTSDLANITLGTPGPYSIIALPHWFYWTPRSATPTDNYFVEIYDPSGPADITFQSLGYAGSAYITSLPASFSPNVPYGWSVGFREPTGGSGYAYYYNPIKFTSTGASVSGPLNMAPHSTGRPDDLPLPPHPEE